MKKLILLFFIVYILSFYSNATSIPDPAPTVYLNSLTTTLITASPGETFYLEGCLYQVNSSQIWFENDGATYGFPMSYLAINQTDVTIVGNNSCPDGTTHIVFYHDQYVDPANITFIPAGIRVMDNNTWFDWITFEYEIDVGLNTSSTIDKFSYVLFISEILCPYEPFGDCQLRDFISLSPEDWFPTYTSEEVEYQDIIVNFTMTHGRLTESCYVDHDFLAIGPLDMCGFEINYNYFENTYTEYPFFYNSSNPNIQICNGEPDPFPLDAPHMDLRFNCFDHTELLWCADCDYYYYYTCNTLGTNDFLNPNDPFGPPLLTWLPYSDCNCYSRPSPLFTYHEGSGEQVGFLTFEDYLQYPIDLFPMLYLGGGYYRVNQTVVVFNKTLNIGGSGGHEACGCDIGLIISENVNPGFLSIDNNLCFTDTAIHMETNSTLAIHRGADELESGQSIIYTRAVGADPDVTITQAYTSVPSECFWMMLDSHVSLADNHTNAKGIIAMEGGEEYLQHLNAFNTFQGLDTSIYSAYGSLVIHNNLITNLNLTQDTNTTGIVIGNQGVENFVSQNVFSGLDYGVVMNGGHDNTIECNIFLGNIYTDVSFPCAASTTPEEMAECSDFVCHYVNAAHDWFLGSYTREYFLDDFAKPNVSMEETLFYISIQTAIGLQCVTPGCEFTPDTEGLLFRLFQIIHDAVSLESWIYLVLDDQPTAHTLDDVIDALCLVLQTESLTGDIPAVESCAVASHKKLVARRGVLDPHKMHHGSLSSKLYVIPECVSSVNNTVVNNYHYNNSLTSGARIYYSDPNVALQNTLDSSFGFDFTGSDTIEEIADFKYFTPLSANSYVHTFGFDTYTDSVTLNITNALEGNETVTRFVHGSYIHDWQPECAPENSLPVLFSLFDNFTRDSTDPNEIYDTCTQCIITFEIPTVFLEDIPDFECLDLSIVTSVNPQLGQWLGLATTYDCDDSDGFYHFSTNCTGSTAHYTIAPPPTTLYVLCEDGTPYPPGIPYYDNIQEAVDNAPNGSTIYLSDGTCCAENTVIDKILYFTSYYPDCFASITCCFDYEDYPYNNGLCDFMFAFIEGSEGSKVDSIHFFGGNNIEKTTTNILINPSYDYISDHYNIPFNHNPYFNFSITNCGFSTSHNGIKGWGLYDVDLTTNQFGSMMLPCHIVTEASLHAEYEHKGVFGKKADLRRLIPLKENIQDSMISNPTFLNNMMAMMVGYASDSSSSGEFGKHLLNADVSFKTSMDKLRAYNRQRAAVNMNPHPLLASYLERTTNSKNNVSISIDHNTPTKDSPKKIVNAVMNTAFDNRDSLIDRLRTASEKNKIKSKGHNNAKKQESFSSFSLSSSSLVNIPSEKGTMATRRWNKSGKLLSSPFSELPCIENAIWLDPVFPDENCNCPKDINYDIDPDLMSVNIVNNVFTGVHSGIIIASLESARHIPIWTPVKYYITSNVMGGITGVGYGIYGVGSSQNDDAVVMNSNYAFDCCEEAKGIAIYGSANISMNAHVSILCDSTMWAQHSQYRQGYNYISDIDVSKDGSFSKAFSTLMVGLDGLSFIENTFIGTTVDHTTNSMSNKRKHEDIGDGHIYRTIQQDNVLLAVPGVSESTIKGFLADSCSARFENVATSGNINLDLLEEVYVEDKNCLWDYLGTIYCLGDADLEDGSYLYFSRSFPRQCGFCSCETNDIALDTSTQLDFFPNSTCPNTELICGPPEDNPGGCGVSELLTCGTGDIDSDLVLCNKGYQRGDQGYCVPCDTIGSDSSSSSSSSHGDDDDDWWKWLVGSLVALAAIVCSIGCITCMFFDRTSKQKSLEQAEATALQNIQMNQGFGGSTLPSSSKVYTKKIKPYRKNNELDDLLYTS